MDRKEKLCETVRSLCKAEGVDFLFITDGKSCCSIRDNAHLKKVADYHKRTENDF